MNTSQRTLHAYCDGGFGNRLNALLTGMVLAKLADMKLQIIWPVNNWCGARYSDIFTTPQQVAERELVEYVAERGQYQYLMTEDHLNQQVNYRSPLEFEHLTNILDYLKTSNFPVFMHTPLIPTCLPQEQVLICLRQLSFMPDLLEATSIFLKQNKLNDFFGIQIRKTDFGKNAADDGHLFELIQNAPTHRFFVCSDDADVEARFQTLPNVVTRPKLAYVEKRQIGDWMDLTIDHSGRVYAGNINRNAQSVRDAVVDLMILSHSKIVKTSHSTFLAAAQLLQASKLNTFNQMSIQSKTSPEKLPLFEIIAELGLPRPQGVLQVGASYGQEIDFFHKNGIKYGLFIEPLPDPFTHLASICKQLPGYVAIQTLCTDETGKEYIFYVASNGGMSSSILKPINHLKVFDFVKFENSIKLTSNTLDDIVDFVKKNGHKETIKNLDTLYMDTQGSELKIMMGANKTLKNIKYIFTEVMRGELYEKQASFQTVCNWLDAAGFTLNNLYFGSGHTGDALFIRKSTLSLE